MYVPEIWYESYKWNFLNCTYKDGKPVTCCGCEGPLNGGFCWFFDSRAGSSFAFDLTLNSYNDSPNFIKPPPQPLYETYSCELCGNDSHCGYDCPPWFPRVYEQEPSYNQNYNDNYYPHNSPSFLCSIQSVVEMLHQRQQMANLITHISTPLRCFNFICYDDDDDYDYEESTILLNEFFSKLPPSIVITTSPLVLPIKDPEVSLIMENEKLNTIPKKESDEFIKFSDEDLVPIPSEYEDTSGSDSEFILPLCDDFSPINVFEEESVTFSNPLFNSNDDFTSSDDESLSDEDVSEENVKIYSNPLFKFDNEYIYSDVNPLFDEVLEDIESKDSHDSNLDESTFLVIPPSDVNEDECFDPGGDVDKINDFEDGYYHSEGDILYLESLLSDDTTPSLPSEECPRFRSLSCSWFYPSSTRASILSMFLYNENPIS
nr:hypothetical protein [Tanacetum cinerariifolium]